MLYRFLALFFIGSLVFSQDLDWTNSSFEDGKIGWTVYPDEWNWSSVETYSFSGSKSIKMDPYPDESNSLRKEFINQDAQDLVGQSFILKAQLFSSSDDNLWQGNAIARLQAVYLNENWQEIRIDKGESFDSNNSSTLSS